MAKRILLLGAKGQLGTDLYEVLKRKKYDVIPLTKQELDVVQHDILKTLFKLRLDKVDYVVNAMAYTNVDGAESNPLLAYEINALSLNGLSVYCNRMNATLIHFSTDYVFDGETEKPYTEDDLVNPLNVYGRSKALGDSVIRETCEKYFIFRTSSLFGKYGRNFVKVVIESTNKALQVVSDQVMNPTYTIDLANVVRSFIDEGIQDYGIYNVCNANPCSWFEFAQSIKSIAKLDVDLIEVPYCNYSTVAPRPKFSALDTRKLSKYYETRGWELALAEFLYSLRQQ